MMKEAPVFIRAYDLHLWLLERLEDAGEVSEVRRAVLDHSRLLLEAVALALARFETRHRVAQADERVTLLRVHLRMASERRLLNDRQLMYANEILSDIGRQIGGWRKSLRGG